MKSQPSRKSVRGHKFADGARRPLPSQTRTARRSTTTPEAESARTLLAAAGRALAHPGLPRSSVFTGAPGVYAYSIDLEDPTRLVQESEDDTEVIGTMVGGRFVPMTPTKPTR